MADEKILVFPTEILLQKPGVAGGRQGELGGAVVGLANLPDDIRIGAFGFPQESRCALDGTLSPILVWLRAKPKFQQSAFCKIPVIEPAVVQRFPIQLGLLDVAGSPASCCAFLILNSLPE